MHLNMICNRKALSIPGYAQYQMKVDFVRIDKLAEGGAGEVYLAKLLNSDLRSAAHGDIAVVKTMKCT